MKHNYIRITFALLLALICSGVNAIQYDFSQGYIFNQKYVERIDLAKGEHLIGEKGSIEKFRNYEWINTTDKTLPANVKRVGDKLVFNFKARSDMSFRDYKYTGSGEIDGESQRFIYLRAFTNYHLLGVTFDHDEPCFLLIAKSGDRVYFVDHP